MITLIKQTLDIVNEMALTGDKEKDAYRIYNYVRNVLNWDFSKMKEDVSWIFEYLGYAQLVHMMNKADIDDEYGEKAWEQLLKHNPSNNLFAGIIRYAQNMWAEKAWNQLLKQNPSKKVLRFVGAFAPEPYATMAKEMLDAMK